ncbi:excinuclease ABC subunit C [Burkholderia multivorans]|uniref:GIY-YIG nuclease family protein n=1 Tax=Burkholderia multivorans TaxID=87883 RepID=UPI000759C5B8|nr:GIY-YIG nuclease family protein [Burkholderia multivorans]KVV19216.1 excinuclease ABC subunit C [Burkholderia multivorans]MBU9203565.1 GIY-YIG nuclease family protein [Burkholderia multivorans]MCA8386600.1 GIY-YIG nuclease family protein [Burkholderia multivorans]MCO8316105.1 GIY-YIG nuclease family protein [Burkholderia multivorans]MCO8352888.1 GIY-YIG nuclease family protein [Burkholderia multivorans]
MSWFLYLIECVDDSVYTGITTDVAARFDEHAAGKGARYTRSRKPRAVLASFPLPDRSIASKAEYWVKRLTAAQKRELAAGIRTLASVLPAALFAVEDEAKRVAAGQPARTSGGRRRGAKASAAVEESAEASGPSKAVRAATRAKQAAGADTPVPAIRSAKAPQVEKATKRKKTAKPTNVPAPAPARAEKGTKPAKAEQPAKAPKAPKPKRPPSARPIAAAPRKTARTKQNRAAS